MGEINLQKLLHEMPQVCKIPSYHLPSMFQLPRDTRALKQGSELPRPIPKGKLGFSSSLILPRADLCENRKIWQSDGCQMGKSASETSRNTLQTLQFQNRKRKKPTYRAYKKHDTILDGPAWKKRTIFARNGNFFLLLGEVINAGALQTNRFRLKMTGRKS